MCVVSVIVSYPNPFYPAHPNAKFNKTGSFDVVLTVHLSIISLINQLNGQNLVL